MANPILTTDILKFMSVRSAGKISAGKNNPFIIKDSRINGEEFWTQSSDTEGTRLFNEIYTAVIQYNYIGKTNDDIKINIAQLLNTFENNTNSGPLNLKEDGISNKEMIDDFVMVINRYAVNFDRCMLTQEIECVLKNYSSDGLVTLQNFVNTINASDNNISWFYKLKEELFNRLYILYIFKRKYPLNLNYVLTGLRALNVIYWLDHDNKIAPCQTDFEKAGGCLSVFTNLFPKKNNTASTAAADKYAKDKAFANHNSGGCNYQEADNTILNNADDLAKVFGASVAISPIFSYLFFYDSPFNSLKPVGVGDLKIVKEKLCKYEAGEISHIENVLKGESKERVHRRLDRLEDIFTREQEQSQETTRDTQTTDRFEVKKEIENTINEEMQANVNANGSVSGSYGLVQYNAAASAGFSYGRSTTDAARSASNFAKEIVDRSVTKVQNKVREARTTRRINETEETNKHGINNENGAGNISGIYRYVNKRYKSQLFNYGKRIMFEFIIPEPAFFFKSVFEKIKKPPASAGPAPVKPPFPQIAVNSISQTTIDTWSAVFNITNLKAEPSSTLVINAAVSNFDLLQNSGYKEAVQVPENYFAVAAGANGVYTTKDGSNCFFEMNIGNDHHGIFDSITKNTPTTKVKHFLKNFTSFGHIEKQVLISVVTNDILSYAVNVTIHCELRDDKKREWQIDTYNKIMDAYDNALKDYENKLAEYNNKLESADAQNSGVEIKGQNPAFNAEIIKAEFKKHCITFITKDYDTDAADDFTSTVKAIGERTIPPAATPAVTAPAMNISETGRSASFIQFIEQAFDWRNLTYLLYSYLWHTEDKWPDTFKSYEETDPLFGAFLRAGSARVLVPVLEMYETSVMHFLYTKEIWNGGEAPAIDDDLYMPIHEEIRNQQDDLNGAVPELDKDGKPIVWEYTVPTSLVYLQDSFELPVFDCTIKM